MKPGKLLLIAALFGLILYGNYLPTKKSDQAPPISRRQGMMADNLPTSDNVEDLRGDHAASAPPSSGSKWYPYTGNNNNHTLPLDFSINNPPWQYWHAEPTPPPAEAQGFKPWEVERPRPRVRPWCPPERDGCIYYEQ